MKPLSGNHPIGLRSPGMLSLLSIFVTATMSLSTLPAKAETGTKEKPKVWIYSDMSDPTLEGPNHRGTINDPDDISAMAGYLLMASEFETLGIVVTSTNRSEHRDSPNQADWANRFLGEAYRNDVQMLNAHIGGYPENITFVQSCIKQTAERFTRSKDYSSLASYPTVRALREHGCSRKGEC